MSFLSTLSAWLVSTLEPYGPPGLMLIAIADSSFLSFPEVNDAALMALSISNPARMPILALMTVIGSIIGCSLLYAVGRKGGEALLNRRFAADKVVRIRAFYAKYGMLAVLIPSLLPAPLPFKIFVLSAGAFKISWTRFLIAVGIGRSVRYFTEGVLAVMYGRKAIQMVAENSARVGVVLAALIVVGALVFVYMRRRRASSGMVLLPLAFSLMASGCIVRNVKVPESQRMKETFPFTRAEAIERLRQLSGAIDTLKTSIGLAVTTPKEPNVKSEVKNLGGNLFVERPGRIRLDGGLFGTGFEMVSNGKEYEVYVSIYKQVYVGSEDDQTVKSECKINDRASKLIDMRPRQIMDALVPDFRPLLDDNAVDKLGYVIIQDQRKYFIIDLIGRSPTAPRMLQRIWFDMSTPKVDIVRRQIFDRDAVVERDTVYKNHSPIGASMVRYPMRFEVKFVPTDTDLIITYSDPKTLAVNDKVDPDAFEMGTHRNAQVCRMQPVPTAAAK